MIQKPPIISTGLTRRKLELLSESISSDKSAINSTQLNNEGIIIENISIEKLYTNQFCQTDFDSIVKDTDLDTKEVFKPITKPVVKSLISDSSQKKQIPVLVPKPLKMLKSKVDEKDKTKIEPLKMSSTSTPRLTKPTNTKTIENVKCNSKAVISKENKQKCNENKNIVNIKDDKTNLQTINSTKNDFVDYSNNKDNTFNHKSNLVKSKKKSIESIIAVDPVKKTEKLTRSKTSIDINVPKMSKRGIVKGIDGWETVIRSRRSNPLTQSSSSIKVKSPYDIKKRFQVPSAASSMPTLALDLVSSQDKPETISILPDKNDRPIISNAVVFPKKKRKPDKPPVPKNKIIDQMRKEMLKDEIEERRMCDEELMRNRQFFDEEMMLAREIRELENAESSCSDDMTQSDRYSDLLDNMILTERMYTINEIKALIQYGNESAIDSIAMPSWDISRSTESIKQTYSARQAKAHQKRQQLLQDKSTKVRELLKKVIFLIYYWLDNLIKKKKCSYLPKNFFLIVGRGEKIVAEPNY